MQYRRSLKKTEHDKRAYCALCFCGCYILVLGCQKFTSSWWRHHKETFAALLVLCAGNSHVPGEFPTQRPVTPSFEVFFDLLNKWLSKQSIRRCFETPSRSLRRHFNMQYRWSLNRTEHNKWFYCALCFCGCIMLCFSCWVSRIDLLTYVTHWGRVTHICVGNLTNIASDNGLSPERRQAIIWTNAGMMLIGPLGTNFSEILIEIQTFSLKKMRLKVSSAKWRPFCLGLNVF